MDTRSLPLLLAVLLPLAACDPSSTSPDAGETLTGGAIMSDAAFEAGLDGYAPGVRRQLLALRLATAPFRNFEIAQAAGYTLQITECMENPPDGGMGFHYGKEVLIDDALSVIKPEVLLYEPQEDGRMRLVGVEYVVPGDGSEEPPVLMGQEFRYNTEFMVWALHAWVWAHNPSGVFADWNPDVTCAHAGGRVMSHS